MRLLQIIATNFGSYESLDFDFQNVGLGLIQGRTGAGKSTIADMAAWALFGVTAKNGNADEVRRWASEELTVVKLVMETPTGAITVTRKRGARPSQHDLFWTENRDADGQTRGKDITDTQRLLEERLGVTADLYLTGAYFHEFSPTGQFFTAKAKDRRAVFEGIANLALPVKLAEAASEDRKGTKAELAKAETSLAKIQGRVQQLTSTIADANFEKVAWEQKQASARLVAEQKAKTFEDDKAAKLNELGEKANRFEEERAARLDRTMSAIEAASEQIEDDAVFSKKLKTLEQKRAALVGAVCSACGQKTSSDEAAKLQKSIYELQTARGQNDQRRDRLASLGEQLATIEGQENPYLGQVLQAKAQRNVYAEQLLEPASANPFLAQLFKLETELTTVTAGLRVAEQAVKCFEERMTQLTALYDLSFELRGEMLKKAVKEIEAETNRILETYFEAEIRVTLDLAGADSLEVAIQKGGYECVYRQLSKGQRGLLKLAFVVSVMRAAANKAGVHFADLFFDEALDGLDSDLKVKAFGLFEELATEHESILLIDHAPEFQNLFSRRYLVTMSGDVSTIEAGE